MLLTRDSFRLCYFYVCVFCRLVVLVKLSVPVQVIDWKDSSPKWIQYVDGDIKRYSLTHSLPNRSQREVKLVSFLWMLLRQNKIFSKAEVPGEYLEPDRNPHLAQNRTIASKKSYNLSTTCWVISKFLELPPSRKVETFLYPHRCVYNWSDWHTYYLGAWFFACS